MSHDPMRERAFGLLSELCGGGDLPADALRTASHTIFDVAQHAGPETLYAVSEALPWMAAFVSIASGDISQNDASMELFARGALRALPPSALTRRLREGLQTTLRRPAASVDGPIAQALREAALLDRRLSSLVFRTDEDLRAGILDDAELLGAALEVCEGDETVATEAYQRLSTLFPQWTERDVRPRSRALRVLEGLESTWDGGVVARVSGLSERARRFELSAVDHLRQNGFLEAVRAALAFAPVETTPDTRAEMERLSAPGRVEPGVLRQFPVFRDDAPLEALALALIETRGRCIAYLRGATPLEGLSPWVDYLRGPCSDLAESRDITIREATSFGHFALHLLNFCDLVAFHRGAANDGVRTGLMEVEDELKEFALVYQQEGLRDGASDLGRFDGARWRSSGSLVRIADRLSRLRGGWRTGMASTAIGAPPRVDDEELDRHKAILERLEESSPFCDGLNNLLEHASILGVRWLETLPADQIVTLLSLASAAARDSPMVDVANPWTIDLRPLAGFVTEDATGLRGQVLAELLERETPGHLLEAQRKSATQGLVTRAGKEESLQVDFVPHPELEAVLTLLSASDDAAMHAVLGARLDELLAHEAEDHTQELVLSAEARDELGL